MTKACPTFLRSSKLSFLVTLASRNHQELVARKCYEDLQSLPILVYQSRLGRDCLCHGKAISYDPILVGMVHYKTAQMIDTFGPAEVFIDLIVPYGPPWPPQLDRILRLSRYLKVLVFFVLLPKRQANYNSILVVDRLKKILRDESMQIPIDAPRLPDSIVRD